MKKLFCDKCDSEMDENENILGTLSVGVNRTVKIWISWADTKQYGVEHLCRNCLIDGIYALDYRIRTTEEQDI